MSAEAMPPAGQHREDDELYEIPVFSIDAQRAFEILRNSQTNMSKEQQFEVGFREALQNAVAAVLRVGGGRIDVRREDNDIVIRDTGVGLHPKEMNRLINRALGSSGLGGVAGFGAGTMSVVYGAPNVIYRSCQDGQPAWEFETRWIQEGTRQRPLDPEAASAFGRGTEVRFQGIIGASRAPRGGTVGEYQVENSVRFCTAMSTMPPNVVLTYNGEPVVNALGLTEDTRRRSSDLVEVFPGCELRYHIVSRSEAVPGSKVYILMGDYGRRGFYLSQWTEYTDEVPFSVAVEVTPTVDPNHTDYPFNPQRNGFSSTEVRDAVQQAVRKFVTDQLTAAKAKMWKDLYFAGDPSLGADNSISNELNKALVEGGGEKRAREIANALAAFVAHSDERHPVRGGHLSEEAGGDRHEVAQGLYEAIIDQPTMCRVGADWPRPDWGAARFDPTKPKSIKPLVPALAAARMLGAVVWREAIAQDPFLLQTEPPLYGFIFSKDYAALNCTEDTPLGRKRFVLMNFADEALRSAVDPDALCKKLLRRIEHEVTHNSVDWHNEVFSSKREALAERMADIEKPVLAAFRKTGAWQALRKFWGLPLKPGAPEKALAPRRRKGSYLIPVTEEEARLLPTDHSDAGATERFEYEIATFAQNAEDRVAAARALRDLAGVLNNRRYLPDDAKPNLAALAQRVAGGGPLARVSEALKGGPLPPEAIDFQLRALDAIGLRYIVRGLLSHILGEPLAYYDVDEKLEGARLSPARIVELNALGDEARWSSTTGRLRWARESFENGAEIHEAVGEQAKAVLEDARWEDPRVVEALKEKDQAEAAVLLATIVTHADDDPVPPYVEVARKAMQTYLRTGRLPKRVSIPAPPRPNQGTTADPNPGSQFSLI